MQESVSKNLGFGNLKANIMQLNKLQELIIFWEVEAAFYKSGFDNPMMTSNEWLILNARWKQLRDCIDEAKLLLNEEPCATQTEQREV